MGRMEEASGSLDRLAEVIVHEVHETNGQHFSNLFYTSEAPLTWSAGMMVYAFRCKLHEKSN